MLTVDMVRAYQRSGQLHVRPLKPAERGRAVELAGRYLALARMCVGRTRGELEEAFQVVPFSARERKIALGLRKLVMDRCDFEVEEELDPVSLRRDVFERASAMRRALGAGEELDRTAVLAAVAAERGIGGKHRAASAAPDDAPGGAAGALSPGAAGEAPGARGEASPGDAGGASAGAAGGASAGAAGGAPRGASAGAAGGDAGALSPGAPGEASGGDAGALSPGAPGDAPGGDAGASSAGAAGDPVAEVDRLLYVDLRSAHKLLGLRGVSAEALVDAYDTGQAQAVLLRAVQVRARVSSRDPATYRALFHRLKFLRLLYRIAPDQARDGYAIEIDGPYSLFRSVTKYGLQLALLLPAIQACERWSIEAEVAWGARRTPLGFTLEGKTPQPTRAADAPALADDVAALVARFAERDGPWKPAPTSDILDLPGVGLCVPDLVFEHGPSGARAYLEVLGFWSRDAVWRRVELVEAGLPHRILFAVSSRLRVSEAVLGEDVPGALYVYKGVMSARAVEEHLDRLLARVSA